ncbi:hypothetical protein [Peptoanaerobacter stomatis]|uniref:hypothetical protein n=1 Tax=Peptoanaerobacter stomatis TaxID=796937 RepID=UPI003FA08BF8
MAISNEFMEAVKSNKTILIRIMLKDSLIIDPTSQLFDEMEQYAKDSMGAVYVEHDGETLSYDVNMWDKDYLNQQMVSVVNNFSKERTDLLKNMVRHIYKDKVNIIRDERNKIPPNGGLTRKQTGVGMTATGAALSIAGVVTSQTVLIVGGIVVAAVGVALIATDGDNK